MERDTWLYRLSLGWIALLIAVILYAVWMY